MGDAAFEEVVVLQLAQGIRDVELAPVELPLQDATVFGGRGDAITSRSLAAIRNVGMCGGIGF